jgi:hypothetical protein
MVPGQDLDVLEIRLELTAPNVAGYRRIIAEIAKA